MALAWLRSAVERQNFDPRLLGVLVNPFYFARRGLRQRVEVLGAQIRGRTLDVGCGQKPYEHLFAASAYVGLELDTPQNRQGKRADAFYDGTAFPFPDGDFDSVVASQVFEHVFNPDAFLVEVRRVLRPGGVLLLTVPFAWDEHEQPRDFGRYSSFGIRSLLERSGFEIVSAEKSVTGVRAVVQMANCYVYKVLLERPTRPRLAFCWAVTGLLTALGLVAGALLPENADFYLDNVVLARRGA